MEACDAQDFDNVSPSVWACLVQKAAGYGITIDNNSGEAGKAGFTVMWDYDPDAQTIRLQCVDHPFWVPCSLINGKIHDLMNSCL